MVLGFLDMDSEDRSAVEATAAMVVPCLAMTTAATVAVVGSFAPFAESQENTEVQMMHPWAETLLQTCGLVDGRWYVACSSFHRDHSLDNIGSGNVHHGSHGRRSCRRLCHDVSLDLEVPGSLEEHRWADHQAASVLVVEERPLHPFSVVHHQS